MEEERLLHYLKNKEVYGRQADGRPLRHLSNDSRDIQPGTCFIAIVGEHFDGHTAIEDVIADGAETLILERIPDPLPDLEVTYVKVPSTNRAQAILANAFYGEPSTHLNLMAVTGTNGKTTTTTMISDILTQLGHKTGLIGTMHYKIDETYYPAVNTTPNALELQRLFRQMLDAGVEDAIIEASSHALALGRLWYTDVDCGFFTNLTREHLDYHGTMEAYANAKSLLFSQLGQHFVQDSPRLAIINLDDPEGERMMGVTSADIVTYSLKEPTATAYASDIQAVGGGLAFRLHFRGQAYDVTLPMQGEFNVSNYLAAFLCLAFYYGYGAEEIIEATKHFKGVTGRMELVEAGQDFEIVVDFAHTADALENVLQELKKHPHERIITVTGHSGGNRDSAARPFIGEVVFKYSDLVILTADNPRFEPVEKIAKEIIGDHQNVNYEIIEDRAEAVEAALAEARPGDIVLIAGKGGEGYQIIGDEKIPYDDVDVVRNYYQQ